MHCVARQVKGSWCSGRSSSAGAIDAIGSDGISSWSVRLKIMEGFLQRCEVASKGIVRILIGGMEVQREKGKYFQCRTIGQRTTPKAEVRSYLRIRANDDARE